VPVITTPFTTRARCLVEPPAEPGPGRPPLLVALHGQGQSGERHRRWMGDAVPAHFASAFPDGFLPHEVRRPDRPIRIGYGWYLYTGDRDALKESLAKTEAALWRVVDGAVAALDADPSAVWLAGFSQGAYLTHSAAVHGVDRVAGWIGQAGVFRDAYLRDPALRVTGRPVLMQHGRADRTPPLADAESTAETLRALGAEVELSVHECGHEITPEMTAEARAWLAEQRPVRA